MTDRRIVRHLVSSSVTLLVAAFAATACGTAVQAPPAVGPEPVAAPVYPGVAWERIADPRTVGYSPAGLDAVRDRVASLNTTGLLVVVGGRVLVEYGDLQQLSYIASVRKSVLALLYGNYVADGTIDLYRTLEELGIDDHGGLLPIERQATVEHLITARSGVYHAASNVGDNLADAPARGSQPPGSYFLYNNWDFNAAGAILEQLTGRDIYDVLATDLASPIGMQDFDRDRMRKSGNLERSRYPAYHMWFSTRDMARIGYLMMREGTWNGTQVVPRDWVATIRGVVTPFDEMNPASYRRGSLGYGYMWWVWDGPDAVGPYAGAYTGSGAYGQYITALPALNMVVAHKTAVPPQRRTLWREYAAVLDLIVAARCGASCR
jgi:CubicO group peptidase (beta-lactamase class C family)